MAPAYVQEAGLFANAVAGTDMTDAAATNNVAPGDLLVICVSTNGAATDTCTFSDNSTEPGDANRYDNVLSFGTNVGGNTNLYIFTCRVTRRITTATSIIGTLSANASRRSWCAHQYTGFYYPICTKRFVASAVSIGPMLGATALPSNPSSPFMRFNCVSDNTGASGTSFTDLVFNVRSASIAAGGSVNHTAYVSDSTGLVAPNNSDSASTGWVACSLVIEEGAFASAPLTPDRRAYTNV